MKRPLASAVLALSLLACGGERESVPVPITPVVEAPVVAVPVVEAPVVEAPTATPTSPALPTTNEPEGAFVEELEHEPAQIEMRHETMTYGRVAYPAPVQGAIEAQLRALMRERMEDYYPGDPDNPGTFEMRCDVTLATAELVAYACVAGTTSDGRGDSVSYACSTHGWEVVGESLRQLELDDLLIAGVQAEELGESSLLTAESPMAPTANGIVFVREDGETEELDYAQLGALLNTHSVLSRVPTAMAVAAERTPLFLAARPPASIRVLTPAQPFARAVLSASVLGARWLFAEQGSAPIDVATPLVFEAQARVPAGMEASERPWTTPARLMALQVKRAVQLRPRPRGRGEGMTLLANTRVYGVLGELSAGPSRTGGGQWTLVVAGEGRVGWLPSGTLQRATRSVASSTDAFVAGLPEAERARARTEGLIIAVDEGGDRVGAIGYIPGSEASVVGYLPPVYGTTTPTLRAWLQHEGVLADVRVVQPRGYGTDPLLLVAWLLPSDPTHHLWEAYTMPTTGTRALTPAFTITLALPSASQRQRVRVTTALRRRNQFYPFVVRGPGRLETLDIWNGTTLVPLTAN